MAAQDHREACGPARHHGDVEPHKQVGLSPLVASRRPRGAERNGLAWKPVAEDHRTGVEGIEGVMSLWKRAHGAMRNLSVTCLRDPSNPHGAGAFRLSIRSVASLLEVGKLSAIEVKHEKPKGG